MKRYKLMDESGGDKVFCALDADGVWVLYEDVKDLQARYEETLRELATAQRNEADASKTCAELLERNDLQVSYVRALEMRLKDLAP